MAFALRRILLTLPLLLVVSFLVFLVGEALPGDPAVEALQQHGTLADVEAWRHAKGLDQPLLTRYGKYVTGIVTEFDFGQRYKDDQPIGPELIARFGATFELTLFAMVLALPLGLLAGIVSAARRDAP